MDLRGGILLFREKRSENKRFHMANCLNDVKTGGV